MVGLVVRKSARGLLGYFEGDFESRIWVDESGQPLLRPLIGCLARRDSSVQWATLEPDQFRAVVHDVDSQRGLREILAVELGFAPPKSVSVAALADTRVSPEIIEAHSSAVDDVLSFFSTQLVARARGGLIDCGVRLFQLPHPWNRGKEPQLHSHIIMMRDYGFSHALWTTVVFLLQRSLREVYHYSLASRLLAQDFRLTLGPEGSLAWELQGIPIGTLRHFSERSQTLRELASANPKGYFSQGAEFRVAGWASRRNLPKTDHSVSLAEARQLWRRKMPVVDLVGASPRVETVPLALEEVFRRSSVLTKEQFLAGHLGRWIGASAPFPEAIAMASRFLAEHVQSGRLLRSGDAYCLPETLEAEGRVLLAITEGFDQSEPLDLRVKKPRTSQIQKILSTRHSVKVISTDGEPLPLPSDLRDAGGRRFRGLVKFLSHWKSGEVLELIQNRQNQSIVIFVEEPASIGDFGDRSRRLLLTGKETVAQVNVPFLVQNRRVIIRKGELKVGDEKKPTWIGKVVRSVLQKDPLSVSFEKNSVTLVPGECPERLQDLNWKKLQRKPVGRETVIYRRVPWERLYSGSWENLTLFAFGKVVLPVPKEKKVQRTIRAGTAWVFVGPAVGEMIKVRGRKQSKLLNLEALRTVTQSGRTDLALIEPAKVLLSPGIPLASETRFESAHQIFRPDEVHIVESVEPDGTTRFTSGCHWPNSYLVMAPAFFVPGFTKSQPRLPSIRVAAPTGGDRIAWLEQLPEADLTVIHCAYPVKFCRDLERDSFHRGRAKRIGTTHRIIGGEWTSDLAPLFPPSARWQELAQHVQQKPGQSAESPPLVFSDNLEIEQRSELSIPGRGVDQHLDQSPPKLTTADIALALPPALPQGSDVPGTKRIKSQEDRTRTRHKKPRQPQVPSRDDETH